MRRAILLVIAGLALSACSSPTSPGATAITISGSDLAATTVSSTTSGQPTVATDRIVVLAEGAAELVAALGFSKNIVGRGMTGSETLPNVPVVAPAHSVNAEAVLALKPSVVIVDERVAPTAALNALTRAGIKLVSIPTADSMSSARARLSTLAKILGRSVDIDAVYPTVAASTSGIRVAFLYLRGTSAIYLVGGKGSGADDLIAAAGGVDVGAQAGLNPFNPLTPEALATQDVDVLLVMTKGLQSVGGLTGLKDLPGVAQTSAAQNGRVIAVDDDVLLSYGLRTFALVQKLSQELTR